MNILYRQTAGDDIVRQFRYYLVDQNLPEIASRFKDAVLHTVDLLRAHPFVGVRYRSRKPELQNLRSWPIARFEAVRIYYLADHNTIHVIRILHGKRDVKRVLERESPF